MELKAHGIETQLPPGWEGRISLRAATDPNPTTADPGSLPADMQALQAAEAAKAKPNPIVHLANFALPEGRGDFGSGAVDVMGPDDVLVVLFEYGPECVGTALFRRKGIPTKLTPSMFSASALQRTRSGQAGCQVFFTEAGRAFCCYAVLGRQASAAKVLPQANATLAGTRILPR